MHLHLTYAKLLAGCAFAAILSGLSPALVSAQNPATQNPTTRSSTTQDTASPGSNAKFGMHVRASKLIGMNIENPEGKNVGQINDLVVDASTGKINYAAVTYGGFLGIGNKMFAVPFDAFQFRTPRGDSKERVLVLNVTQQQLEGSVGFDEDHWPNFADENFINDLDRRYNIQRDRSSRIDIDINRRDVDVDVNRNTPQTDRPAPLPRP